MDEAVSSIAQTMDEQLRNFGQSELQRYRVVHQGLCVRPCV